MAQEPLPSLNWIYSLSIQEEQHLTVIRDQEKRLPETMSMAAHGIGSEHPPRPWCSHCGKPGHDVTSCYRIVGFPDGFVFTNDRVLHTSKLYTTAPSVGGRLGLGRGAELGRGVGPGRGYGLGGDKGRCPLPNSFLNSAQVDGDPYTISFISA